MEDKPISKWRQDLYIVIFGVDTFWGRIFDIALLLAILLSVLAVMLESVESISANQDFFDFLYTTEWIFTILFTLEYIARILVSKKPLKYVLSFYGLIDLLSILPSYLSLVFTDVHMFAIFRSIRLLRVFRVLKLVRFMGEAGQLMAALRQSRAKITVFIGGVLILVVLLGSIMFLIEGRDNGFTSIPRSIYWAIVTLTTVGYGDIAPQTILGQMIASGIMILGYGIIAVPTGIVTSEMAKKQFGNKDKVHCPVCNNGDNDKNASFCKLCGTPLDPLKDSK